MPVIRCRITKEGKLLPIAVEFLPDDRIHFESDQPVHLLEHRKPEVKVKTAFNLGDVTAEEETTGLQLNLPSPATGVRNPPPPPPGYIPITIYVPSQKQAAGTQQAGAAGGS
jgi:hypothetical protein